MKKILFAAIVVVIGLTSNSQEKKIILSQAKVGSVKCEYKKVTDLENSIRGLHVSFVFQNEKYKNITDTKVIVFLVESENGPSSVTDFLKDIKAAFKEMDTKQDISWDRKDYSLNLYDFSKLLYLYKDKGYTTLSKKEVEKMINWIESLGLK